MAMRVRDDIVDIGFHAGEDTIYFVSRGFNVLAVEANPGLLEKASRRPWVRLAQESGQLRLLNRGIVPPKKRPEGVPLSKSEANDGEVLPFYVHRKISLWSTMADRSTNPDFHRVNVPTTTCRQLLLDLNVAPLYMKVDIEGFDKACIRSLLKVPARLMPRYISTEDPILLDTLEKLGYNAFKLVDQSLARQGNGAAVAGLAAEGGSGKMLPEEAPSRHPDSSINGKGTAWYNSSFIRADPDWQRILTTGKQRMLHEYDLHGRLAGVGGGQPYTQHLVPRHTVPSRGATITPPDLPSTRGTAHKELHMESKAKGTGFDVAKELTQIRRDMYQMEQHIATVMKALQIQNLTTGV